MRIVWHLPRYDAIGCGMSRRAAGLATGLARLGHDVRFVLPADGVDPACDSVGPAPIERVIVPHSRVVHWSLQARRRARRAAAVAAQLPDDVDAVVTCQPELAAAADRPVVVVACCCQLLYEPAHRAAFSEMGLRRRAAFRLNDHLLRRGERRGLRAAGAIAFDSNMTRGVAVAGYGLSPPRCHVVAPTVDLKRFRPASADARAATRQSLGLPEDAFVVAWAGRMADQKNVALLIEAAALASDALPELRLLLVGDGPHRPALRRRAAFHELEEQVRFVGMRPDVECCLAAADLFALPSRVESFGIAALEAQAAGLPCVVLAPVAGETYNGAIEAIEPDVSGVALNDASPRAMAEAWLALADDAPRAAMGAAARRRAEMCFAAGRDAEKLEGLLASIAG